MGNTPKISSFFKRKSASLLEDVDNVTPEAPILSNRPTKTPKIDKSQTKLSSIFTSKITSVSVGVDNVTLEAPEPPNPQTKSQNVNKPEYEHDTSLLEPDPGLRKHIYDYPVNKRDEIRRDYIITLGPHQPKRKKYPDTISPTDNQPRRFQKAWFKIFPWLEYSPKKNKAYCFPCFLFATPGGPRFGGQNAFVIQGFDSWKKVKGKDCAFCAHEGKKCDSVHKSCVSMWNKIHAPSSSSDIQQVFKKLTSEQIASNRLRLKLTIDLVLKLTCQAVPFRGLDETVSSKNRGNFLEFYELVKSYNEDVKKAVNEAPKNATYTSHHIQKEILEIIANKVKKVIREEIGDAKFCIIVDEARDEAKRDQMRIVLRFVNKEGLIQERFFGVTHVLDTTTMTLKEAIYSTLTFHNFDVGNIRGQGFDGASNMGGEFNGLQALIAKDCPYAYYVHCFAHRLQLALVASAKEVVPVQGFFTRLIWIANIVSASCKRNDELKAAHASDVAYLISVKKLKTGKGKNQIGTIQRPGDTRWSSHLKAVCSLVSAACSVLLNVYENGPTKKKAEARSAHEALISFDFVLILHLMKTMMGITDLLCQCLQNKTQDILNAMEMVLSTKSLLQQLRDNGFDDLLGKIKSFCEERNVDIPHLVGQYKSKYEKTRNNFTVEDHYRVDIFYPVIDSQLHEMNRRFSDNAVELLSLSSALNPRNHFATFIINDVCELARKFYLEDFTELDLTHLRDELQHYEHIIVCHVDYKNLLTISELCRWLVRTNRSIQYPLVFKLIVLVLTLPVSTATAERSFSAMKLIKTTLRNKMEDEFLTNSMMVYIEKDIASMFSTDSIIDVFAKKGRRVEFS